MRRNLLVVLVMVSAVLLFQALSFSQEGLREEELEEEAELEEEIEPEAEEVLKNPYELIEGGDRLYSAGDYEGASALYDEAYRILQEVTPLMEDEKKLEELVNEADLLLKEGKYQEAVKAYDKAQEVFKHISKDAGKKSKIYRKELKKLKKEGEERTLEREEAKRFKEEYIKELKERRKQDIIKRRAELKEELTARKKEAAQRWQAVRDERIRYKGTRVQEKAQIKAEREALALARKKLKEEKLKEAPKEIVVAKKPQLVKVLPQKITAEEIPKKEKLIEEAVKKEELEIAIESQKEKEREEAEKKQEAIRLAKLEAKEKKIRLKKDIMRARLERIDEAMFKMRTEKEASRREKLKKDAISKAGRCKHEFDTYSIKPDADQRMLRKAEGLIARGDTYFNKEMYKESGELYDRAILTLKGKLH